MKASKKVYCWVSSLHEYPHVGVLLGVYDSRSAVKEALQKALREFIENMSGADEYEFKERNRVYWRDMNEYYGGFPTDDNVIDELLSEGSGGSGFGRY